MYGIALRTLRFRKAGFAGTFVALFLGAALIMVCGGLMETGIRAGDTSQDSNENLIVLAALSGGFALIVAMFVVASTLGLSVQQRRRELALLRAVGATPRQVRRLVHGETFVLAVLSGGLACALAPLLGGRLFDRLTALGVADAVTEFHLGWIPMAAGAGCGLLIALSAATVAARRAGATRPVQALTDAALQAPRPGPLRAIVAALCFGSGIALAIVTVMLFDGPVAASVAGPAVVLWAIGVAAILPEIITLLVGVLRRPVLAVTGLPGYLALTGAPARATQLAAVVTPIMLASGIAIGNLYIPTTQAAAGADGGDDLNASVGYLLAGTVLAYTVVSVVNTLVMATTRRRGEYGLQRITGSTRGQVLAMMAVEAALVATIGVVLGTLLSTATLVPFSLAVSGSPVPSGPLWIYLAVVGVAGALTMIATLVPVWFATRGRAVPAAATPA